MYISMCPNKSTRMLSLVLRSDDNENLFEYGYAGALADNPQEALKNFKRSLKDQIDQLEAVDVHDV